MASEVIVINGFERSTSEGKTPIPLVNAKLGASELNLDVTGNQKFVQDYMILVCDTGATTTVDVSIEWGEEI